ncbi:MULTISPECIES: DUF1007 family protein [unclassified Fibrobacter]|uniref:DUF1007 family protein n=1 Tax=unclassified Fibrobacter TaxID=2634177 RepID=UPI002101AE26|nr:MULTISPECIES: DUF1007 family protein [unclassified Fibrobacter]
MLSRALALFLFAVGVAFAHPHVFLDATVKVLFNETGLTAVRNHWVYDEMYSTAMMASGDKNGDGSITGAELAWFQKTILDPVSTSNYFNYVLNGTKFLGVEKIVNFKASMNNGRLTLDFDVVFTCPVKDDYTMIVVVVADPSNYIQVTTDMDVSDVDAPESVDVEFFDDGLDGLTMFRAFQSNVRGLYLRFKKQ